ACYNKGDLLNKLKRFDEALEAYDRALALDPKDVDARLGKETVLRNLGREAEACECVWEKHVRHVTSYAPLYEYDLTHRPLRRRCAWLSRHRRLSKHDERKVQTSETLLEVAMMRLLVARHGNTS
ncbi:MAG TPA: tetratricopeptide repeat protein, partial [Ktedonobacterales bacterium]|nr:tetratricopeptide repeat protein [Ktedonobacterales bacterium]